MAKCKGCGQEIIWVKAKSGKSIPCNPDLIAYIEDPDGDLSIVTHDGRVIKAREYDGITACDDFGRISHFATCPQADRFRRR